MGRFQIPQAIVPASVGGKTLLSTTALTGNSVTVSNINQGYTDLFFVYRDVYFSVDGKPIYMILNADSANNTFGWWSTSSGTLTVETTRNQAYMTLAKSTGATSSSTYLSTGAFTIANYTSTGTKTVFGNSMSLTNAPAYTISTLTGAYYGTSGVSSINLYTSGADTFSGGSLLIYGVK